MGNDLTVENSAAIFRWWGLHNFVQSDCPELDCHYNDLELIINYKRNFC